MGVWEENKEYLKGLPAMSASQADIAVMDKEAPKVTRKSIIEAIDNVAYFSEDTLTVSIVTMKNGFKVVGKSACASPENFDEEVGMTYAFEDAVKQLWSLEGYLLRQRLHEMYEGHDAD